MRINKLWKIWQWLPFSRTMPRMISELKRQPELGFIHARTYISGRNLVLIQYWRSVEQLFAYALARDHAHLPAWRDFNRRLAGSGDVGIWHETYRVRPGDYEAIYSGMPPFGLGCVGELVPATGAREHAADRLKGKAHAR
jgi:hypothetical protein